MRRDLNFIGSICAGFGLLFIMSCSQRPNPTSAKLPPFSVTNSVVGGELRDVVELTNGISFYFTQSNLVVWFQKDSSMSVEYEPKTLKISSVCLEIPRSDDQPQQAILDINADGVPDARRISGEQAKQIFFNGEWYATRKEGNNSVILVKGKTVKIRFDSHRWVPVDDH